MLGQTSSLNQTFGLVLGLIGLIFFAAIIGVLGIEVNVVLARGLWPRALLTPFTDAVDLTEADRRAYAMYAQSQRHKGFETVTVRFDGRDGDTHEIEQVPREALARPPGRPRDEQRRTRGVLVPAGPLRHRLLEQLGAGDVAQEVGHRDRREHGEQRRAASPPRRAPASQMPHQTQASPK